MSEPRRVVLLHAYRAANLGDGWLVSLARDVVADAGEASPIVFALDPAGMPGDTRTVLPSPTTLRAGAAVACSMLEATQRLARAIARLPRTEACRGGVGVGGAYLRAKGVRHGLVFRAHHLPQLQLLARLGERAIYLPVSIGPLPSRLQAEVLSLLHQVGTVCTRDDRSAELLEGHPGHHRVPDLAACAIGRERPRLATREPNLVTFVLRDLPNSDLGMATARELLHRKVRVQFGVQSSAGHTNDDTAFYRKMGVLEEARPFGEMLAAPIKPSVVVAGRLHAALASIHAGVPTIHLGYERKSWGAFADLGLSDWVVHAWQGETSELASRVDALLEDPRAYWAALEARFGSLEAAWGQLVQLTKRAIALA